MVDVKVVLGGGSRCGKVLGVNAGDTISYQGSTTKVA